MQHKALDELTAERLTVSGNKSVIHGLEHKCQQLQERLNSVMDAECTSCTEAYEAQQLKAECRQLREEIAQAPTDEEVELHRAVQDWAYSACTFGESHPDLRKEAARVVSLWRRSCHWLQEQAGLVTGMERLAWTSAAESCLSASRLKHQCDELRLASSMQIRHAHDTRPPQMKQIRERLQVAVDGVVKAEEATQKCVEVGHCENTLLKNECKALQQHIDSVTQMEEEAIKLIDSLLHQNQSLQEECRELKQGWKVATGQVKPGGPHVTTTTVYKLHSGFNATEQNKACDPQAFTSARVEFQDAQHQFRQSADLAVELRQKLRQMLPSVDSDAGLSPCGRGIRAA